MSNLPRIDCNLRFSDNYNMQAFRLCKNNLKININCVYDNILYYIWVGTNNYGYPLNICRKDDISCNQYITLLYINKNYKIEYYKKYNINHHFTAEVIKKYNPDCDALAIADYMGEQMCMVYSMDILKLCGDWDNSIYVNSGSSFPEYGCPHIFYGYLPINGNLVEISFYVDFDFV